jgi:hypothetical protein
VIWALLFFDSLIFCCSLVCSNNGSFLALWIFELIGLLRIGLLIMALVMVGRGELTLGVSNSLGTRSWVLIVELCWVVVFPLVVWT